MDSVHDQWKVNLAIAVVEQAIKDYRMGDKSKKDSIIKFLKDNIFIDLIAAESGKNADDLSGYIISHL